MIKDNLQHVDYYNYLTKEIQFGLKYIKDTDFTNIENGRYELVEGKIFANVQEYVSKPVEEGKFEAHKKYIDIQFIVTGEENFGVGKLEDFSVNTEYDAEKDIAFFSPISEESYRFITLKEKEFVILLPSDVHMPSISVNETKQVKKVVLKILVEQ